MRPYNINPITKIDSISVYIVELNIATNTLQFLMIDNTHKIKNRATQTAKYINILPTTVFLMTDSLSSSRSSVKPPYCACDHTSYNE